MSNQAKVQELNKATYTKPSLIEYGSLAEQTRMFGFGLAESLSADGTGSIGGVVVPPV